MTHLGEGGEHGEQEQKVAEIKEQLKVYGEKYKIRGLEGRLQQGLDPAGMLAVEETRTKLQQVAEQLGADMEAVIQLTNELHTGAIWQHAAELAQLNNPEMKTWLVAGEATTFGKDWEDELTPSQFLEDLERVNRLLDQAVSNLDQFIEQAGQNLITTSNEKFHLDEDVPVSEADAGFLAMAINGYKAGIVKAKIGLLFVGAGSDLKYSLLEGQGLHAVEKHDPNRNEPITFYVDEAGQDIVKKLSPSFGIVLSKDLEIAKMLARSALTPAAE